MRKIADVFQRLLASHAIVSVQCPVRLDEHSEPEPDIALLRPEPTQYAAAHPTPADVSLLIEVAHSSVAFDREVKIPLYARAAISETWLVDLALQQVEIYRDPAPLGYREKSVSRRGQSIAPQAFPQAAVNVDDLLA